MLANKLDDPGLQEMFGIVKIKMFTSLKTSGNRVPPNKCWYIELGGKDVLLVAQPLTVG